MNYLMITYVIGIIMTTEAGLLAFPLIVSLIYGDNCAFAFIVTIAALLAVGVPLIRRKPDNTVIYAREGFIIVSLAWIVMSVFGAIPYMMSGAIPNFIDAFFETVSGFTTTGASTITNIELLPRGILFWHSFTHWVGGMGVLVFVMAIIPLAGGRSMYLMKAESPGPSVGKIMPRIRSTAMVLYGIYIFFTVLEVILLCLGGMPLFDSLVNTFGSVATGGFSIKYKSIAFYDSAYVDTVITVFMLLCGINFQFFYLIICGHIVQAFKSEELRTYLGIIAVAVAAVMVDILHIYGTAGRAFRYAVFQVASVITTTGYATADFNLWPPFSRVLLVVLMILGASAGSTAGGLKISRLILLIKSVMRDIKKALHPRAYTVIRFEGKVVDEAVVNGVGAYFSLYMLILVASLLLVSINEFDFTTTLTAVIACINNIGPGLGMVGPMGNFSEFNSFSKIILTLDMLMGRLEIIPLIMLASPAVWREGRTKKRIH